MKTKLLITILLAPFIVFAQESVTVKIENLKKPTVLLPEEPASEIFQKMIVSDMGATEKSKSIQSGLVAQSHTDEQLVDFGYHAFFNGMYAAYADHRPFVLSPDMIWLLIAQGFAHHVNNNAEELRSLFVDFTGKRSLTVVKDGKIEPDEWETIFPEFTGQISSFVGKDLIDVLSCNFSTTNLSSKMASEITSMKAMESYFKYIVMRIVCGIPEVKLEGTPQDWEKVLEKAQYLKKYQLDWWIDELEPILKEFIKTSQKKINKNFWKKMFIFHSGKSGECGGGEPDKINGWVVKFFPYDKDGKRLELKEIWKENNLPNEIVKVDMKLLTVFANDTITEHLELWAGFIGLKQNAKTYALEPQIGWMIKNTHKDNDNLGQMFKGQNFAELGSKCEISTKTIPQDLLDIKEFFHLIIHFSDEIAVPDEMANITISQLEMTGKISEQEIERIRKMFPDTNLYINGKR